MNGGIALPGPGSRVVVWGFGRHGGGLAAARFCAARGARVTILDTQPAARFGDAAAGWEWQVGDGSHPLISSADLVVASPAIPPRAWPERHAPRTSPEGLFCRAHSGPRIAVSGTKGKSTTAHILATLLGWEVAGNSYEPLLDVLARHGAAVPLVCELSSFQLWYLGQAPPAFAGAVFTSLAVDHLDWHPDLIHYRTAKLALLGWAGAIAVDPDLDALCPAGAPRTPPVQVRDGAFHDGAGVIATREDLPLLGAHNARNAALVLSMALHRGIPREQLAGRLRLVRGLPHRLEFVPARDARRYLNDSIATTPESAMAALLAVDGPLSVILGGSDKGASYDALAAAVARRGAVPVLIGTTAARLAAALSAVGVEAVVAGHLPAAFAAARAAVPPGGTVLLSPACASFDQFQGFEDRGERFRALVRSV